MGTPLDCDVLCLAGGQDIATSIYGEEPIHGRAWGNDQSYRDKLELEAIKAAQSVGAFLFGICRGGQLLNCVNGGTLWQDVDEHHGEHLMTDLDTVRTVRTSSIHHQAMRPTKDALLVATCSLSTEKVSQNEVWRKGVDDWSDPDVEVCWYPETRSLCMQGHPEYGPNSYTEYCFSLLERFY